LSHNSFDNSLNLHQFPTRRSSDLCIWCHEQGKDSCSKGLLQKSKEVNSPPVFKKSELGALLAGCPLEERISEFHKLKTQGLAVGDRKSTRLNSSHVKNTYAVF